MADDEDHCLSGCGSRRYLRQLATSEGRAQAELIREALAEYIRRRKRPAIPGIGEFDSGHTDTSQKAEQMLRRAAGRGKWR
jgi:hypothetical protein